MTKTLSVIEYFLITEDLSLLTTVQTGLRDQHISPSPELEFCSQRGDVIVCAGWPSPPHYIPRHKY